MRGKLTIQHPYAEKKLLKFIIQCGGGLHSLNYRSKLKDTKIPK